MKVVQMFILKECWEESKDRWNLDCTKLLWEKVGLAHLNPKFGRKNRAVNAA